MNIKVNKTLVLFLTGYCVYIALEVSFRNVSYPIMGVCGGVSMIILDKINDNISWDIDLLIQGTIGSIIITTFEFIIGEIMIHSALLPIMWDYSNLYLNIDGVVSLLFSALWVGLSICAIMIADVINYYIYQGETVPYYKLFGKTVIRFQERT